MTNEMRQHVCPNCGAPLGIPQKHERFFKCQFCGTVLEDQATQEEQQTGVFNIKITSEDIAAARMATLPVYSSPPVVTFSTSTVDFEQVGQASRRAGCVITGVVLTFTLGIILVVLIPILAASGALAVFLSDVGLQDVAEQLGLEDVAQDVGLVDDSGLGGLQIYNFGPVTFLPSDNDTSPDFAGVGSFSDDTDRLIYVDFEASPVMRWSAQVSQEATYVYNTIISSATLVYLTDKSTLFAYNRQNGALAWQAALADEIQYTICEDCVQLMGDALVTLTADGTLAAYDAKTGAAKWSVQMNEAPRQVVNFGGNPGVLDQVVGSEVFFQMVDLASGTPAAPLRVECPNEIFSNSPQTPGIYDPVFTSADGSAVYFIAGSYDPGCVQRWNPAARQMVWQAQISTDVIRSYDLEGVWLADDALYVANGEGVFAISTADGAFRELVTDPDYDFRPLGVQDGVIVVYATRTRGTSRVEIWGVDTTLGNVKWTFIPPEGSRIDNYGTAAISGETQWIAGLASGGLSIVQFTHEPATMIFQLIPLQSGTASSPMTVNVPSDIGAYWVEILGWRGSEFWAVVDSAVTVVETATGTVNHTWP